MNLINELDDLLSLDEKVLLHNNRHLVVQIDIDDVERLHLRVTEVLVGIKEYRATRTAVINDRQVRVLLDDLFKAIHKALEFTNETE